MKKIFIMLLLLCLAGCGTRPEEESADYTLEDTSAQRELFTYYNDLIVKNNMDKGYTFEEVVVPSREKKYAEHKKIVADIDVKKHIAEMEDITDKIYAEKSRNNRIYMDKEYPELMLYEQYTEKTGNKDYTLVYDVYAGAEEYRGFIEDITEKTGLIYSGTNLGKRFKYPELYDLDSDFD